MIVIFGGAYQGKHKYALERFGTEEGGIYYCSEDSSRLPAGRIICGLEKWLYALVHAGLDTGEAVTRLSRENPDSVVICADVTCGVVPVEPELRAWREAVGRALTVLSRDAVEVIRLFCGIPTQIKISASEVSAHEN